MNTSAAWIPRPEMLSALVDGCNKAGVAFLIDYYRDMWTVEIRSPAPSQNFKSTRRDPDLACMGAIEWLRAI